MSQAIVIPCYNEAERLVISEIDQLLAGAPELQVLLVDDGSTDATGALLQKLSKERTRVEALLLPRNQGKAEAVRRGLLHLLKHSSPKWVGYADADFATPASELVRLLRIAEEKDPDVLLGSRVLLLGTDIERKARRHYLGRVFATFASLALQMPVYDTQCGAKFFKVTPFLREALAEPFHSRWAFDVEFIGRMKALIPHPTRASFIEAPLQIWHDIKGSKLRFTSMLKAGLDLLQIAIRLRRRGR